MMPASRRALSDYGIVRLGSALVKSPVDADELGMNRAKIAKNLRMAQPGAGYTVNRGSQIVQSLDYKLMA